MTEAEADDAVEKRPKKRVARSGYAVPKDRQRHSYLTPKVQLPPLLRAVLLRLTRRCLHRKRSATWPRTSSRSQRN